VPVQPYHIPYHILPCTGYTSALLSRNKAGPEGGIYYTNSSMQMWFHFCGTYYIYITSPIISLDVLYINSYQVPLTRIFSYSLEIHTISLYRCFFFHLYISILSPFFIIQALYYRSYAQLLKIFKTCKKFFNKNKK
jgi:hypothetical protein